MRGVKFIKEREEAIRLRKQGLSIIVIEKCLHINRSTLSGWFQGITLSPKAKAALEKNRHLALVGSRQKAVAWHNAQKAGRLAVAEEEARGVIKRIDLTDKNILEFGLAMLYWGEGFKNDGHAGMGNSDPSMLKFFIHILKSSYQMEAASLTAQLHLRADQNELEEIGYWSGELGIPQKNFKWTQFDKRTIGRKTYEGYHGVCTIYCYDVAIQRKLANISRQFVEKILR